MTGISDKPLDAINEDDLKSLVDEQVLECRVIEYKKTLPNFNIPKDKKEFLADVSSFANSSGGDLIYGIEEDKGIPVNLCGLDIPDTEIDKLKRQIEGIIRLNVGPRIPGISIQPLKLGNRRYAIIIRILKSWASPHIS
jgi:predicted HTH transcriptional regulator